MTSSLTVTQVQMVALLCREQELCAPRPFCAERGCRCPVVGVRQPRVPEGPPRPAPAGATWSLSPRLPMLPAPPRNGRSEKTPCPAFSLPRVNSRLSVAVSKFSFSETTVALCLSHFPCFCRCQDPASSSGSSRPCLSSVFRSRRHLHLPAGLPPTVGAGFNCMCVCVSWRT